MKLLKVFLIAAVIGLFASSCTGKSEAEKVGEKIESGQQLTPSDYKVVIDYLGKYAEEAQPIQDNINNLPAGDPKAAPYQEELNQLTDKNNLLDIFRTALEKASQSELGADNVALVNKYAGYEWFTAPDWATIDTDPGVGGIELESPSEDSTGVVAGGVVEAKVTE